MDDFKLFWLEYVGNLKKKPKYKSLFNVLETVHWRITDDKNVEFTFDSTAMILEFDKNKEHFLKSVRKNLNNYAISVHSQLTKSKVTKSHIKSRREIFNELVEKNPAVELLRQKFNLNIETDPD